MHIITIFELIYSILYKKGQKKQLLLFLDKQRRSEKLP